MLPACVLASWGSGTRSTLLTTYSLELATVVSSVGLWLVLTAQSAAPRSKSLG